MGAVRSIGCSGRSAWVSRGWRLSLAIRSSLRRGWRRGDVRLVADQRTPGLAQVYAIISRLVGLPLPPIAHGIGPTLIPRPERLYFWFGDPIDTVRFEGRAEDDDAARRLRDEVRRAVQSGIEFLLSEREADPRRGVIRRALHMPTRPVADPEAHFVARAFDAMNEAGADTAAAWMSRWVQLEDPPGWPGEGVWRGRAAAIARMDEVIAGLGASRVDVEDARSVGEGVLVRLGVVTGDPEPRRFYAAIEIDGDEIIRIRVFLDEQARGSRSRIRRCHDHRRRRRARVT